MDRGQDFLITLQLQQRKRAVQQRLGMVWLPGKQMIERYQCLFISLQVHQGSRAIQQSGGRGGMGRQSRIGHRQRFRRAPQRPQYG